MLNIKKSFLLIIFFFFVLAMSASYVRFVINKDYIVEYKTECYPETDSCFIECEDDECNEVSYYVKLQKDAKSLFKQCGDNITECKDSLYCMENDVYCKITYCDAYADKECSSSDTK